VRLAAYLILIGSILSICCGCGSQETNSDGGDQAWLVKVGETEVTVAEFKGLFDEAIAKRKAVPDTASARAFLKQIINNQLYDQIAVDSVPWSPILEHRAGNYLENDIIERLKYDTYGHYANIEVEELERIYEEAGNFQYRYLDAVFAKESDAAQQKSAIDDGADFQRIAEYFGGANKGDAGFRTVLEIFESVIGELSQMSPGEIRGPIEAGDGYHIIQLIETADNPTKREFAVVKEMLRTRLFQDRGGKKLREFNAYLLEKYDYRPIMENVYWMNDWLREETKHLDRSQPSTEMVDGQRIAKPNLNQKPPWLTNPFTEEEGMRPIVATTVDSIPALYLLDELVTKPVIIWPTFETPDELILMAKQMAMGKMERAEALSAGYAETPEFIEIDRVRRQKMFTRNFKTRFLQWRAQITEADAKAWYDERYGNVESQSMKRYAMLMVATEEQAKQTVEILKNTGNLDRALRETRAIDPSVFKVDSDGLVIVGNKTSNAVEKEMLSLDKGSVTKPHLIGKRWAIGLVKDVSYRGAAPFEDMKADILRSLTKDRIDSLLSAYLEQRRAITEIKINEPAYKSFLVSMETEK
jgi:PPIC-type PPIASE domain